MTNASTAPRTSCKTDDAGLGFDPPGLKVDVRQVSQKEWSLLADLSYSAVRERFVVTQGTATDFASVPRVFAWFMPTYGKYTKAAVLHDELCRRAELGEFDRREADGVFRQAMRLQDVDFLRRWVVWTAVRLGALTTRVGRRNWWKDAWLVLPISFFVSFVVLPPAVMIGLALVLWYLLEFIAWGGLSLSKAIRQKRGQPSKRVNTPRFSLRL